MDNDITRLRIYVRGIVAAVLALTTTVLAFIFVTELTAENPDGAVIALLMVGLTALGASLRTVVNAISANPTDGDPDKSAPGPNMSGD